MIQVAKFILVVVVWLAVLFGAASATAQTVPTNVRTVDCSAQANGNGTSWTSPFNTLQAALDAAHDPFNGGSITQIWVKEGVCIPTAQSGTDPRTATFRLRRSGLRIMGGFKGCETSATQRNPVENTTVLSGRLPSGNAFHVITVIAQESQTVNNTMIIDGFTISDGLAHGAPALPAPWGNELPSEVGAGVLLLGIGTGDRPVSPAFVRCTFQDNIAALGAAVFLHGGQADEPVFFNSEFHDNVAALGSLGPPAITDPLDILAIPNGAVIYNDSTFLGSTAQMGQTIYGSARFLNSTVY